jgi:hypothetical protein
LFVTKGLTSFVENALIGMKRCGIDTDLVLLVFPAESEVELGPLAKRYGARQRLLETLVDIDIHDIPDSYVDWNTFEFNAFLKYRFPALRAILAEETPICEFMPRPVAVFLISSPEGSRQLLKICPTL